MIDPNIEHALAPDKIDWKEPLWAKFKSYAIGFGAALLVVGAIVAAIAYFAPPLAPQTEPTTTAEPSAPAATQKSKPAVKSSSRPTSAAAPVAKDSLTTQKPKPAEPLTQFDRDLAEFERKIP